MINLENKNCVFFLCLYSMFFNLGGHICRFSGQLCGYKGIEYSSPTLASAMGNLTPAFTFIFAVIFRFFSLLYFLSFSWSLQYLKLPLNINVWHHRPFEQKESIIVLQSKHLNSKIRLF